MYPLDKNFLPTLFSSFFNHYMEDVAFTTPPHTAHLKGTVSEMSD